jgi:hypothetical protein
MEPAPTLTTVVRIRSALAVRLTTLVMSAAFVGGAILPPAHCHPSNDSHEAVMHRHASPHVLRDAAPATLADDDGRIIWSDGSYLAGTFTQAGADPRAAQPATPSVPPDALQSAAVFAAPPSHVHDPPWHPSGSRAPPTPLSI